MRFRDRTEIALKVEQDGAQEAKEADIELKADHAEKLRGLQARLHKPFARDPGKILELLGALKEGQAAIEASLYQHNRAGTQAALSKSVQAWVEKLAKEIRKDPTLLAGFDLHQLETLALGITACLSLGHPNLFVPSDNARGMEQALETLTDALSEAFLHVDEDILRDHAGPVFNIENWVGRVLKSGLIPPRDSMRKMAEKCFTLMRHWATRPKLDGLTSSAEAGAIDRRERAVKRAGKGAAQVQTMTVRHYQLLPLGTKQTDNRKGLVAVVQWLGSVEGLSEYENAGMEGLVSLSTLAHLLKCLLEAGYLRLNEHTRNWFCLVMDSMTRGAKRCTDKRSERALSSFCSLAGALCRIRNKYFWDDKSSAALNGLCSSLAARVAALPEPRRGEALNAREAVSFFAFLRAAERRVIRNLAEIAAVSDNSSTAAANTTTSTTAAAITTTTSTTSALTSTTTTTTATVTTQATSSTRAATGLAPGYAGTTDAAKVWREQRVALGEAAHRLLCMLAPESSRPKASPSS